MYSISREFPGFDALYYIEDPFSNRPYRGKVDGPGGYSEHEKLRLLLRGELTVHEPIIIKHAMGGGYPTDVIWTTSGVPLIINQRVVDLLNANKITGWSTYPVTVYTKSNEIVPDYSGLSIHGRSGPIDESKSDIVMREFPAGMFPRNKGYYFDPESWDGSDLFMAGNALHKFCSTAVKQIFTKAKVKNIEFIRMDEVEYKTLRKKE